MSEILEKLQAKLRRALWCELIMNIILGVWAIIGCVCFLTDAVKIHAVLIVLAIIGLLIIVADGYFIFAFFHYKHKSKIQKQKEGILR